MSSSGTGTSAPTTGGTGAPAPPPTLQRQKKGRGALIAVIVIVIVVVLVVLAGYEAGWFKSSSSGGGNGTTFSGGSCTLPGTSTIAGAGSTLVGPLMDQWASSYTQATVGYTYAGSSAGITDITDKVVDYGASDAPLDAAQQSAAPGVLTIPESAGGVVPIYNIGNGATLHFTGALLAQIYMGTVTNWQNSAITALNPTANLPNATIIPVHRSDGSGTSFIFTSYLSAENATWAKTYGYGTAFPTNISVGVGQPKNGGVASYVGETPDTIGYVDLNYALNSGSGVGIGAVENPSGNFIRANVTNTASALKDSNPTLPAGSASWYSVSLLNAPGAGDYPITSLTYVLVYQDLSSAYSTYTLTKAENLVDFLGWVVTVGQNYSAELFYVPLPQSVIVHDETTIESMTFDGSAVPICIPK